MPVPASRSDGLAAVTAVIDAEVAAVAAGDHGAFFSLLDEDAMLLPPGLAPKSGPELREWMSEFLSTFTIEWLRFTHEETRISGDLAYHRYEYAWRTTEKDTGDSSTASGKGVHILRRRDGAWKLLGEIWNASPDQASS